MNLHRPALITLKILVFIVLIFSLASPARATEYQNCSTSQNCTLGEFLYDDTYSPDATASCTLTSRKPDGTVFLNSVSMVASSSGWYSYPAAIDNIEGIYPTEICCTTVDDYLCLDKTFRVSTDSTASSTLTAKDVWTYSDRSVTTFGNLISDIWNYNTRSVTSFGNLIADMWSHDSRSLTSSNYSFSSETAADIKTTKNLVKENRLLLEQLINKPIVKTFIDEAGTPDLTSKIEQTKQFSTNLYSSVQNLKSRALILSERWPTLTESEVKRELTTLSSIFKQDISQNQKDTSILAATNWLKTSWNSPILLSLSEQAQAAQSKTDILLNDLTLYSKANKADVFAPALSHILSLNDLVGTSLAPASDLSLFGFLKKITDRIALLDKETQNGQALFTQIKKDIPKDHTQEISKLSTNILAINEVPQVNSFFIRSLKNTNTESNKVLGLLALIDTNKLILAGNTGTAIKSIWLEEGSIIFRAVATNPSKSLTQSVLVKYYLPSEVKKEQVINFDSELTIDYDPVENALFASGEISLDPQETRTFMVEVEDIWTYKQEEITSLKTQVNELIAVLKNTTHYPQAVTTKTDIDVTLDKIMLRQTQAITPENRIRTYRESALDMNGVEQKIYSLKELILQTQTPGSFLGFFGGVQSITLWGIVFIIISGFAFLVIYLNALRSDAKSNRLSKNNFDQKKKPPKETPHEPIISNFTHRDNGQHWGHRIARIAIITLLTSGIGSIGTSIAIKASRSHPTTIGPATTSQILGTSVEKDKKFPYTAELIIPDTGKVAVRTGPSISMPEIKSFKEKQTLYVYKIIGEWAQVGKTGTDQDMNWWINAEYLEKK
jgi:hypothetical protein